MKRSRFIKNIFFSTLTLCFSSCGVGFFRKKWSFGLVSDIHYADRPPKVEWKRCYRKSYAKFKVAIDFFNTTDCEFVTCLGDLKDQKKCPSKDTTLSFLEKIELLFSSFKGDRFHVLGNHDLDSISKQEFLDRVTNTGIEKSKSYYSFNRNDVHFVVLDSCFKQDQVPYNAGNFEWYDAALSLKQLDWLKEDLNSTSLLTIVFIHHPLDDFNLPDKRISISNAPEVREVLEQNSNVKVVFQGHHHDGNYSYNNGIHYYTMKSVVDGLVENNFALVTVDQQKKQIVIDGHGETDDKILQL